MKLDQNLVVLITGGSSGLGEASVRLFLDKGCKVALLDKDIKRMKKR